MSDPSEAGAMPATSTESFAIDLAFAAEIAASAGELLMAHLGRVERISHKSPKDVVTEVDELSERLIVDAIREAFPEDGVLAEESGRSHGTSGAPTGRTWVIDPLDGTVNYANGIPIFCVAVALVIDGRPTVGVVRDPIRGETLAATAAGAATVNGRPIQASTKPLLSDFVVSLTLDGPNLSERLRAIRSATRVTRRIGSAALALAWVGAGRFDAFAQSTGLSTWDVAAAGLIAERAGAVVSRSSDGGRWFDLAAPSQSIGLLAAPAAHHGRLLELLSASL